MESEAPLAKLEAVLFLAREPLTSRKLAQLAGLADGTQARTLIRKLRVRCDVRASGFQVEEIAGGFQLLTRPQFGKWLRRLQPSPVETRLSAPALETLVVVAYCQPVLRAEIEAVRGVQCGEILRQLLERDLIRIAGRSSELGRPFLYGTTKRFLQVFGLRHLDQLPWADELRSRGLAKKPPVENLASGSHDSHSSQPTVPQKEEVTPVRVTDQPTASVPPTDEADHVAAIDDLEDDASEEETNGEEEFDDDDEYEYEYDDDEYDDVDEEEEEEEEEEEDGDGDDEYEYEYVDADEDEDLDDDEYEEEDEWEEVDDDDGDEDEVEWDDDDIEWDDDELDDDELEDDELEDDELEDEFEDDELDDDELEDDDLEGDELEDD